MQKRSKILAFAALFLTLFVFILYYSFFHKKASLWNAIPPGSAVVLQCSLDSLENLPDIYVFKKLRENKKLLAHFDLPENQSFLSVLNSETPDGVDVLFLTEALPDFDLQLRNAFDGQIKISQLQGVEVFQIAEPKMTVAQHNNILLVAPHAFQVETAIEQLNKRDFNSSFFKKNHRQGQLILSLKNLEVFLNPFFQNDFQEEIASLAHLGDMITANFLKTSEGFAIQGNLHGESDLLFRNPISHESILSILPQQTLTCFWGKTEASKIETLLPISLQKYTSSNWFDGEFAIGNIGLLGNQKGGFLIVKINDKAQKSLLEIEDNEHVTSVQHMMYEAYTFDRESFFTQHEDYLLIFSSKTMLQSWVNQYSTGQTLLNDPSFAQLRSSVPSAASGFAYVHTNRLFALLQPLLEEKWREKIKKDLNTLGSNHRLLLTFEQMSEEIIVRGIGAKSSEKTIEKLAEALPAIELPAKAVGSPKLIKSQHQILLLIEDELHRLHAFSDQAELLWTVELEDHILSEIQLIQTEKGEEQILFNTPFRVHAYDLSGQPNAGFPFDLPTKAHIGMCIIDFTKTGRYKYLVACENGGIYGYDLAGNPLEGWNPKSELGSDIRAVQHFQNAERDFIVVAVDSSIQVFDSAGKSRFPHYVDSTLMSAKIAFQADGNYPRIVAADGTGRAHILNLEGANFKIPLASNSSTVINFIFEDVWGDERKDYLTWKDKTLNIYAYAEDGFAEREKIVSDYPIDRVFVLPYKGKNWIGGVSTKVARIMLYDGAGNVHPSFPLAGDRVFSIHNNIVYATEGNLLYRYYLEEL